MMKKNQKKTYSGFDEGYSFFPGKKVSTDKGKGPKRKLSIYDEYEEEEDDYLVREKFKKRNK